jgi:hypothetical protein
LGKPHGQAVNAAIGDPRGVAPFFRIPGLYRSKTADEFLARKSLAVFSADEVLDDWHHGITPKQIVAIAMRRIEAKNHRGILLLHEIRLATVIAAAIAAEGIKRQRLSHRAGGAGSPAEASGPSEFRRTPVCATTI